MVKCIDSIFNHFLVQTQYCSLNTMCNNSEIPFGNLLGGCNKKQETTYYIRLEN